MDCGYPGNGLVGIAIGFVLAVGAAEAYRTCLRFHWSAAVSVGLLLPWSIPLVVPCLQRTFLRRCDVSGWDRDHWLISLVAALPWSCLAAAIVATVT